MKVTLPDLDFNPSMASIHSNRDAINAARTSYQGALKALAGLAAANAGMCSHPNKVARHDPGYAGGGFRHYECPDCDGHTFDGVHV
jgi:hypothetical protein